jgi:CHASE2 domain-containing sensor protein
MKVHTQLGILFYSIAFSACQGQAPSGEIALVNVGDLTSAQIAEVIEKVNSYEPAVVAIDIEFEEATVAENQKLTFALWACRRLVMPSMIDPLPNEMVLISMVNSGELYPIHARLGFVSTEDDHGQAVTNKFITRLKPSFSENWEYHFSVQVASLVDSVKTARFVAAHPENALIQYDVSKARFKTFNAERVLRGEVEPKCFNGKIVILGFLGPGPLDKYTVRTESSQEREMYGVEILAYIVLQILDFKK